MSRSTWTVVLGAAIVGYLVYAHQTALAPTPPCPCPAKPDTKPLPKPKEPAKRPKPCPGPGPCPRESLAVAGQAIPSEGGARPVLGGTTSPDGTVEILYLPPEMDWPRNIASRGLGCCGFRSFDYCGRIQNVPSVVNLPESMRDKGIAGGDYPQKHSQIVAKLCPGIEWWQDTGKHIELLEASFKSQRPCCVDYNGHDPHYSGGIAHCVTLVACDVGKDWVAILDNNYPSLTEIVWMSVAEFSKRWGGWSYGLLAETPGRYCAVNGDRRADTDFDRLQEPVFGGAEGPFGPGETTIGDQPATVADIIERFGGEFAPKLPVIPVNVDHRIDLENLQQPALAAFAAGFMLWVLTQRKESK